MKSIAADLLLQRLDAFPAGTLNRNLYECLRSAILDGSFAPGSSLPASRDLAQGLGVSRNTVLHAYSQLQSEGYVESRIGSGTYVAVTVPDRMLSSGLAEKSRSSPAPVPRLSSRGRELLSNVSAAPLQWGAFMPGVPDVTEFPSRVWSQIHSRLWRNPKPEWLSYTHGGGLFELRCAIASHLQIARSVRCTPEQIIITEGVHHAIDLTLRMLTNPGDRVWVEEPGYWGFHTLMRMNGVDVKPMRVDKEDGVAQAGRPRRSKLPRLIFVTPSHQYPLGSVMGLVRRKELLAFARESGSWIVEDDYDSDFRFSGHPIPSMQGLEDNAPVVYVGTFSKTLYPGLRIAYMVLPKPLAETFRAAQADLYREGHGLTQAALAELLNSGRYASHIRRMRVIYARRRGLLRGLVQTHLGADFLYSYESSAGLHLALMLPHGTDDEAIAQAAQARGILTRPLSRYYLGRKQARPGLLLGYACVMDEQIEPAFFVLLQVLKGFGIGVTNRA